eukprot:evm.model.scf_785.7 EVM.evm.TU.scf_785.7   scf_785:57905-59086(-)
MGDPQCLLGLDAQHIVLVARLVASLFLLVAFSTSLKPALAALRARVPERRSRGLLRPRSRRRIPHACVPLARAAIPLFLYFCLLRSYAGPDLRRLYWAFAPPHSRPLAFELGCPQIRKLPLKRFLGRGFYASVYESELESGQPVAVKMADPKVLAFHEGLGWQAVKGFFAKEVRMLRALHGDGHTVNLLGACGTDLVLEFLPIALEDSIGSETSIGRRLDLSLGVARAVAALHSAPGGPIVHTDLRPEQFMVDEKGVVKLVDLNRAVQLSEGSRGACRSGAIGRYKSPEEILDGVVTPKSDIYSMGMTLYAVATGRVPFERLTPLEVMDVVANQGLRPRRRREVPEGLAQVMEACWRNLPLERPTAQTVVKVLEGLVDRLAHAKNGTDANSSL